MPPKPKDAKKGLFKVGTALKDIIPPTLKQPIREGKPAKIPEFTPTNIVINPYQPQAEFEEWPGDEAALNFDFGLESQPGNYFVDSSKISVPPSFRSNENQIIFWRRPRELVRSEAAHDQKHPSGYVASENQLLRHKTVDLTDEINEGGSIDIPEDTGASPFEKEEPEVQMFQTIERQETPEEAEQRVKEMIEKQQQLEKGKKKPTKKEEPIDNTPQKIKDVILSDICLKEEIPAYSKWIASQLQIIKDRNLRDVHTKKPIWTKVYPQREGIPVFNPHGRYWVKLYHNGKEKKIEIDDKIPVIYGKSLFAKSAVQNEIWPYIIAKALIKLNSPKWQDENAKEVEVGDGSIIYALTGYLPETINLGSNLQGKWKTIADFLGDKKFSLQEQHITCFCLPDFKPTAVSLKHKNGSDSKGNKSLRREATSPRSQSDTSRTSAPAKIGPENNESKNSNPAVIFKRREQVSLTTINTKLEKVKLNTSDAAPEHSSNIIPGFAYSIIDLFENESFNMVYVLKRTENDLKLRTDFLNLQKVNLNKMTKEEKLEHRRIKKELKEKIYEEDNKRFELIKKPAIHYKLLKIKSSINKAPPLNFNCPFDQEDIGLAKKCILNKLSKPPNYDMYDLKMDDKSVSSAQVVLEQHNKVLPLDDFSRMESAKDPLKRDPDGTWLSNQDFEGCFQYIQIFHDPTKFKYRESFPVVARPEEEQVNYDDKEVIVIEGEPEEEKESSSPSLGPNSTSFLYSFASTRASNLIVEPKPLMVLQKFDFQNFEVANTYKTLNQMHDSDHLILENKNQIFRIQVVSPLTSYLWILSNLHFRLMSFAEFLCVYEGYQVKNQQIEYPIIEKNRYHLFYKGIVPPLENPETILCRIKNNSDLIMLKYIRLKIVELTDKSYTSPEDFKSGVVTSSLERNYYVTKSVPIPLEANKRYMIMIEGRMSETVNEGVLEFDVLFKNPSFALDLIEQVEPLEYFDKYIPTKYGILFRERLFLNNETQASFFVRICDILNSAPQAAAAQKGKKVEAPTLEEKDLSARRTIKLELFRENELVAYAFGQNKVIISNATLYPTNNKDEQRNYYLQASFNLREWPEGKEVNDDTCNLHWILKVASSDTIAIFRDTQKEDNIKAIKKSWEDKEPGRLDKAKTARKKFMIIEKQRRGEPLDNDEIQLLNEPRQRKNKEEEVKKDAKGKPQPKPKAPVGKGKKEEAPVEEKKEERPLPKSENHVMDQIGQFLVHMEQPRLLFEDAEEEGTEYVRTDEEKDELREKILLGKEEAYGMYDRNKRAKDKIKDMITENRDKIVKDLQVMRESMKEKLGGLMKERDTFRKGDKEIKDKERAIINLCKQEKPVYDDVVKCITENSSNEQIDPALIKILEKVKKNVYITEKVEKLNTALTVYDLPTVTTVLEEIRNEGIEANPELLEKADELIDMAEKNPTFIADKQKEAQKALKGKKK